jgi:hypothetical protein
MTFAEILTKVDGCRPKDRHLTPNTDRKSFCLVSFLFTETALRGEMLSFCMAQENQKRTPKLILAS